MFLPAIWLIYQVETEQFGPVPLGGMTYWSGLWAMVLLLLALAIAPAVTIFRWTRLVVVRRMIGVTALAYTIAHIIIYFALKLWNFPHIAYEMVTRVSLIVATIATIGLIALGATSWDAAVRRMGPTRWQRLHNTVYVITALAVIHYLLSPDIYPDQFLITGLFFWLIIWRLLNRRGRGTNAIMLVMLAVGTSIFTIVMEVGWVWAYHGYEPSMTFSNNFNLDLGLAPAWKLLAFGVLIAFASTARQALRPKTVGIEARGIR
jgi:sulfoxide reductase heme-binding subunit YedZ